MSGDYSTAQPDQLKWSSYANPLAVRIEDHNGEQEGDAEDGRPKAHLPQHCVFHES
jgi:hypothetical protein